MLEAPDLGNEDGVMPKEQSPGKPTTRRYTPEEKTSAVRMVRALRAELGTDHGTVQRVARQLGYGMESVRSWVRQADIDDGYAPGVSTMESQRIRDLEQENRELKRANEILKRAASFFAAELCATRRQMYREVVRDRLCWAVAAA
jgi:transposase-like protein